jgi:D-glycero-D-manno-heptose 1,7-bisphosphate phosphatase
MALNPNFRGRNKAVLFDKDGTLIRDVPYNVDPSLIELAPGAAPALVALQAAGYRLGIVTNQSGVARGYFDEASVVLLGLELRRVFELSGVEIECFLFCPHHPDGAVEDYGIECDCRKPKPGLVRRALATLDADPAESWFVGDILNDVEAGARAGCRTVLLDVGNESEWVRGPYRTPSLVVPDLLHAARAILEARLMAA